MNAPVRYRVSPQHPHTHEYRVSCTIRAPSADGQRFTLPSWIRGSYLVRDFAKHVIDVHASDADGALAVESVDKRTLRCAPARGALTLHYRVHAFDDSVRKAWLDSRRGFFNGSSLFYCPEGFEQARFEIELLAPEDAGCAGWRVATALPAGQVDGRGFGLYCVDGYEALIDHPVEMGELQTVGFEVDGIPHALVLSGRCRCDGARLAHDLQRICSVERALFGGEPDLDRYLFLTHVVGKGYGGLEHRSSCALVCSRGDLPQQERPELSRAYRGFLGLCSHEYFHLWNVKRITAQRFAESRLGAEAYTRDLWHYEGVTSYYDDLFLLRAGIVDAAEYLDMLAEHATRLERTPGRRLQSVAQASFDAWIKLYQPDANTPNAAVSYYTKGAMVALCLDLLLRRDSSSTLDDVMRAAWARWGRSGEGVPEGGLEQLAQEVSGLDLGAFFDHALRSTEELPLAGLLADFGIAPTLRPAHGVGDNGGRGGGEPPPVWLGWRLAPGQARVAYVASDGPAAIAGVHPGDQLVAIDDLRLGSDNAVERLSGLRPGERVDVHLFRDDELLCLPITPVAPPADTWVLTLADVDGLGEDVRARRRDWLGV